MARLVLPSRLELKRLEGSANEAPLAKVIFTTALYVSPVQMIPSCSHTGTPRHFHSSTTSGSASFTRARSRRSISPRQSPSSSILASISWDGDLVFCDALLLMPITLPRLAGRLACGDVEAIEEVGGGDPQHEARERPLVEVLLRLVPDLVGHR